MSSMVRTPHRRQAVPEFQWRFPRDALDHPGHEDEPVHSGRASSEGDALKAAAHPDYQLPAFEPAGSQK